MMFSRNSFQLLKSTTKKRWLSSLSSMKNGPQQKAKVALIGTGRMGQIRASILHANPKFDLCGIVDVNVDFAQSLADQFGVKAYPSLEACIDDDSTNEDDSSLDGIVICSPTFTHESIIQTAVEYNSSNNNISSIFTEKPVDETASKIAKLFKLTDSANVKLCCGFQRRFDPSYVAATNAIHSGNMGSPLTANIFFADHPSPPKEFLLQGGDIFMDLSCHDIDYIAHTLQDQIVSVYATGTSSTEDLANAGVYDNAVMVMNFKKGATVTLFMSRSSTYGYDNRCEVFCDNGLVKVENPLELSTVLYNADGMHQSKFQHSFPQRFEHAFKLELEAFANTILEPGKEEWPVTAQQCITVQQVADAARISSQQGQVVYLNDLVSDHDYPMYESEEEEEEAKVAAYH